MNASRSCLCTCVAIYANWAKGPKLCYAMPSANSQKQPCIYCYGIGVNVSHPASKLSIDKRRQTQIVNFPSNPSDILVLSQGKGPWIIATILCVIHLSPRCQRTRVQFRRSGSPIDTSGLHIGRSQPHHTSTNRRFRWNRMCRVRGCNNWVHFLWFFFPFSCISQHVFLISFQQPKHLVEHWVSRKVCALALQKVNFMFQVENQTNCNSKRCDQQRAQHLPPKHRRRNRNSCHNATMPTSIAITSGRPKALSNKIRIKRFESCGEAPTCVNILTPCFDTEPKGRGRGRGRGRGIAKRPAFASLPRDKNKPNWHRQLMPLWLWRARARRQMVRNARRIWQVTLRLVKRFVPISNGLSLVTCPMRKIVLSFTSDCTQSIRRHICLICPMPERQENALAAALSMQSRNFTSKSEPIANERQWYIRTPSQQAPAAE